MNENLKQWSSTFSLKEPNPDLQFCYRAAQNKFITSQLTRFVIMQNEVFYAKS